MRRPAAHSLILLALVAALVTACTGSGTPPPTTAASATATATVAATATPTAPSPSGTPGPSAAFTITPSASPSARPSPPPPATGQPSAPGPTTAPEPSPSGAFACGYPLDRPASRTDPVALIHDVRVGAHDTYDRVVFELLGAGVPRVRLERVTPPFVKDPSGLPLTVAGTSFVKITLMSASGGGYATPDGQPTYSGATSFNAGFLRLTSLVQAGDFEGITTWYAGLTGPMCHSVFELGSPARLVIDLRAP